MAKGFHRREVDLKVHLSYQVDHGDLLVLHLARRHDLACSAKQGPDRPSEKQPLGLSAYTGSYFVRLPASSKMIPGY